MLLFFFNVVMYALFVLSVHVYYVNCNAKSQMGLNLCALIKLHCQHRKGFVYNIKIPCGAMVLLHIS
jgi:hypothetical protein